LAILQQEDLGDLSGQNKRVDEELEKIQKRRKRRIRHQNVMPLCARRGPADPGRVMILRESDRESIDCLDEVQDEIRAKGYDRLEGYYVVYKRSDMFAMIFKFANVEGAFSET
jgi:hypothetical protein